MKKLELQLGENEIHSIILGLMIMKNLKIVYNYII